MKKKSILSHFFILIILLVTSSCNNKTGYLSNDSSLISTDAPGNFFGKPNEYFDWQSKNLLKIAESVILKNPPNINEPHDRQMAMIILDAVFHEEGAPHRSSVQDFHIKRSLSVLQEIENTKVSNGIKIWKLYNTGIIIRSKTITVAFDLTRGLSSKSESFALPENYIDRLAQQCDILFISHSHEDHADEYVANIFLKLGKLVVTPPDVWENKEIYSRITHLERKAHEIQNLKLDDKEINFGVVVYPGHQDSEILNNVVVLITPENYSVCHTGDQSLDKDFSWIDEVKDHLKIDLLLPNCWTMNPSRTSEGFDPKLIIPTHENELGHTIDHREAYALNYSRWNAPYKKVVMTWGESFHYIP